MQNSMSSLYLQSPSNSYCTFLLPFATKSLKSISFLFHCLLLVSSSIAHDYRNSCELYNFSVETFSCNYFTYLTYNFYAAKAMKLLFHKALVICMFPNSFCSYLIRAFYYIHLFIIHSSLNIHIEHVS